MNTAAVIGCGRPGSPQGGKVGWGIAYAHAEGYRDAFPDVTLHAVDPNADNLAAFGLAHGIPASRLFASTEALYDTIVPDAVSICTWPPLHVPQAIDAARRGVKAIAVEKPLGVDGYQIHELIGVTRATGARVAVAHQRRYEPWFVKARELIQQAVIGDRLVIEARVGDDWDMLSWTVHWFDMANFLFDAQPQWILAGLDHQNQHRYGHAVEQASIVLAHYDEHRQAMFITGPPALPHAGVTVRGDRGMLVIEPHLKLWTTDGYRQVTCDAMPFAHTFAALLSDLWQSSPDRPCRCDLLQCAPATLMAFAAHESARTQRRVAWPLQTWFAPLEVMQHPPVYGEVTPLRIALLADGHQQWPRVSMSGREGLRDALESLGHHVTVLDAAADLADNALDEADALVLYHTQQQARASHRAVVGPWFESGRPVVVSHCGIGAYADWPQFRRWIGRYWVWSGEASPPSRHPHVPCTIRVDDAQRFPVPWREAWLPTDEMYQGLGEASLVRVLATAVSPDGQEQAYAWQVIEHPHVVGWLPGHRRDMFALEATRDGLAAALQLAVASATTHRSHAQA